MDIFKDAIILNGLLRKYALFRTDSLDPYVLERNYFFVSPMKVYVHYKIPEVLMHLLDFAIPSIKKLEIVLPTNGNFDLFEKTMKESGIKIYTTKDNYESINFDEFRRDLNEIKVLTIQIKQFEENSTSVTLFINNEAILNLLPETLRRILTDFEYFKSTIFLWPNDKPKDVHKYVEDILRNNEIIVTKKINKKFYEATKRLHARKKKITPDQVKDLIREVRYGEKKSKRRNISIYKRIFLLNQ